MIIFMSYRQNGLLECNCTKALMKHLSKPRFTRYLLEKFKMETFKAVQTAVKLNAKFTKATEEENRANTDNYVGLMYLACPIK
jgi:hypothetical protein